MFPPAPDTSQHRPSWRAAVRRAVDLVVAFATLDDPELDEPRDEPATPARHVDHPHAHRLPRRPAPRAGRPGAVPERSTPCVQPTSHRPRRSDHQRVTHSTG